MSLDAKLDRVVARAEELSAILAGADAPPARRRRTSRGRP